MKKAVLIGLYILFHLFILRDLRTPLFSNQIQEFVTDGVKQIEYLSIKKWGERLIYIDYREENYHKTWHYKFAFGSFFLLAVVGLILAGADKTFYIILISIHALTTILASFVLSYFVYQSIWSLAVIDMFSRYLIPLSSIGIIPLSIIDKRNSFHERKAE